MYESFLNKILNNLINSDSINTPIKLILSRYKYLLILDQYGINKIIN